MSILNDISLATENGKSKIIKELVPQALDQGVSATEILNALMDAMSVVGEKFKAGTVFVPDMLVSARAMKAGTAIIKPYLIDSDVKSVGKIVLGTVQGDLHDIGKNLVGMMLEGKGFEVIDLGVDVAPEQFINTAIEQNAGIIACSSLLSTTMPVMGDVIKAAIDAGIRDKVSIMVGGAPVTQEFADSIGADIYTNNAASAADCALQLIAQ